MQFSSLCRQLFFKIAIYLFHYLYLLKKKSDAWYEDVISWMLSTGRDGIRYIEPYCNYNNSNSGVVMNHIHQYYLMLLFTVTFLHCSLHSPASNMS